MRFRRSIAVFVLLGFCIGPVLFGTQRGADWWPADLAAFGNWSAALPVGTPVEPEFSPAELHPEPVSLEANQTPSPLPQPPHPISPLTTLVTATQSPPPQLPRQQSGQPATSSISPPPSISPFSPARERGTTPTNVALTNPVTPHPPNSSGDIGVVPRPSSPSVGSGLLHLWYFGNLQPHHTNWAPVANFIRWVEVHRPQVQWLWCPNPPRPLETCSRLPKTEKAQDGTVYVFCPNDKIQAAKCTETAVAHKARVVLVVKGRAKRGAPPPGQAEFGVLKHLRALNYTRLAVFLTTDELCTFHSSKINNAELIFTQYYHHRLEHVDPSKVFYLPTGVASKFPIINPQEHIPGAARKFVFNLVCSIVTNKVRQKLKLIIEKNIKPRFEKLPVFEHYAHSWSGNYDNKSGYLPPHRFKAVLLDSVFTLMPSGHNPECYRLYESMEAGSIPVVALEGLETHCVQPFIHFLSAPMVFLDTWDQLPVLLQNYTSNPAQYWRQAEDVVRWYTQFQETIYGTMVQLLLS